MSQTNFEFSSEDGKLTEEKRENGRCSMSCPLGRIPEKVWLRLLRPSFRQRHPVIFWGLMILIFAILFFIIRGLFSKESLFGDRKCIALISIKGTIIGVDSTLEWIRKVENNASVQGVILRVDSPGGGAAASQEIYAALARMARKKPIAVSMGASAASGGYMVSMAGARIFANPSTITGSIGVRMDIPQLQGLMGKIGIGQETLVSGRFKDAASYARPLTEEDRAYLQSILSDMHRQFVEIVARGRRIPYEKADALANGKIYTGREALALGLIDALGGQEDAMAWLAEKTGVPATRPLLKKPEERGVMLEKMLGFAEFLGLDLRSLIPLESLSERVTKPAFLY